MIKVPERLRQIEQEHHIRVLYAVESGSRAWGTNSDQSDFDIRFIYIRPREDYLRLEGIRDVLEFEISDKWDMVGWDLQKALRLLYSSNSQLFDWLKSPVVYWDDGFSQRFTTVAQPFFHIPTVALHYASQSDIHRKKAIREDPAKVKQYLYALQHLLASRWVLEHRCPVPLDIRKLMAELLPEEWRQDAAFFLERKTGHPEQPFVDRRPRLEVWLKEEAERIRTAAKRLPDQKVTGWSTLNGFFLSELERL